MLWTHSGDGGGGFNSSFVVLFLNVEKRKKERKKERKNERKKERKKERKRKNEKTEQRYMCWISKIFLIYLF